MKQPTSGLLIYLLLLTSMFILLEISFSMQWSGFYLADFKLAAAHISIPLRAFPGIVFFIFAQLFLHLLFTFSIWGTTRLSSIALNFSWDQTQRLGFTLWCIALVTILFANQYYFPNSKFSLFLTLFFNLSNTKIILSLLSFTCFFTLMLALVGLILKIQIKRAYLFLFIALAFVINNLWNQSNPVKDFSTNSKPNIIIIGVDALRPDALGFFSTSKRTPYLDQFLQHATVFANAYTAIARTFPSWVSILTGNYPMHTGARFDLADQTHLDLSHTLPALLRQQGYETLYAMDETRFSNIGSAFGFDQIITPPAGINDFLLGSFNDFPLSNLVVNSKVGQWLFPYSYANRPAYITYNPNTFLAMMAPHLSALQDKPVFLAVHFCLTHSPYVWAGYHNRNPQKVLTQYKASIKRVDQQIQGFMALLQKDGLLNHAIVILLSDHGEALELRGDRITQSQYYIAGAANQKKTIPHFYPPTFKKEKVDRSAGHGTDVLGLTQSHSVLAIRTYGLKPENQVRVINDRVSLLDIAPTVLSKLHIADTKIDGDSLQHVIWGQAQPNEAQNDFFIESDFSPQSVRSVHPETRKVLLEGINFYQLNPKTCKVTVKPSMAKTIISSKQHADIYGHWILALYPQQNGKTVPILVNTQTLHWTNDLHTRFAENSPAKHMMAALSHFYGKEVQAPEYIQ